MIKKALAALGVIVASLTLSVVPAYAHHPNVVGQATCGDTQMWHVQWTATNSETIPVRVMHIVSPSGFSPTDVVVGGHATLFQSFVNSQATATITVTGHWLYPGGDVTASTSATVSRPTGCSPPPTTAPPTTHPTTTTSPPTTVAPTTTTHPSTTTTHPATTSTLPTTTTHPCVTATANANEDSPQVCQPSTTLPTTTRPICEVINCNPVLPTTTLKPATTTTVALVTSTTMQAASTTTQAVLVPSESASPPPKELPFTGSGNTTLLLIIGAFLLIAGVCTLAWYAHNDPSKQ